MKVGGVPYRTVWMEGATVRMIDQPLLPNRFSIRDCPDYLATAAAIRDMVTRGAGAIGVAAGYAVAQAALGAPEEALGSRLEEAARVVRATRPTAQNLFYCVDRVLAASRACGSAASARHAAVREAEALADEDVASARRIGELGAGLLHDGERVLTHCNAGWLAFADWGTALAPIYAASRRGLKLFVWVDETRPRLQGASLTAWELGQEEIEYAIIADNAAGFFMQRGEVDIVIVGADRIARNGDVANKVGTYEKAVVARDNGVPFYVAAPTSTVDWSCPSGASIPIEERGPEEVLVVHGRSPDGGASQVTIGPPGSPARNPAFDVTPGRLVTGIITERGIVTPARITELEPPS